MGRWIGLGCALTALLAGGAASAQECQSADDCAAMYQPLTAVDEETVTYDYDGHVYTGPDFVSDSARLAAEIRANGGRVLSNVEELIPVSDGE